MDDALFKSNVIFKSLKFFKEIFENKILIFDCLKI
jgi:hypothetical protein